MPKSSTAALVAAGAAVGIVLGSGVATRWGGDISVFATSTNGGTLLAGLGGAILGSTISGYISYLLALRASAETLARDAQARLAHEQVSALRVIAAAVNLLNIAYTIEKTLDRELAGLAPGEPPFSRLRPFIVPDRPLPSFDTDDFVPFIKAGTAGLIQECEQFAEKVGTLDQAFSEYGQRRRAWDDFAAPFTVFDPVTGKGDTQFSGQAAIEAKFRAIMMIDIIVTMQKEAPTIVKEGVALTSRLDAAYKKYFGPGAIGLHLEVVERH